tara:strand:- start:4015 stop:4719 length:705 start_codon:yes stop_codon:yes gene_type:complete
MPLNYNFAFKNSKLKRWVRPKPKNVLASKRTNKEKLLYLYQTFRKYPELFYPSGFIILFFFTIEIINLYPQSIVKKLESKHIEYELISQKIATSQSKIKSMKRYSDSIKDFYNQSMTPYLFAFYLQKSLPTSVRLNEYFISENEFDIQASAYEIKSLNEMVTLLINSPVINRESTSISKISQDDLNGKINFTIEIKGKMLKLTQEKRQLLYEASSADGLLQKLSRFKSFSESLR